MTLPADCAAAYREVRLLGQGGCGRVYLCSQVKLDRLVAIKLLDASVTKNRTSRGVSTARRASPRA